MILGMIIATIVMGATFAIAYPYLPPQIPLFYSRPWGEAQIADIWYLALLPILLYLCIGINLFVSRKLSHKTFVPKLLTMVNFAIIIVTTISFLRIIAIMTI